MELLSHSACQFLWSCLPWGKQFQSIRLNDKTLRILRVLGEGGFSYVYLVSDVGTGMEFALKKIRCLAGANSVKAALKEVEASARFSHRTIIKVIDHVVVQEPDGSNSVYLLLPFYKRGNVQELVDSCVIKGTRLSIHQTVAIAKDACIALSHVHGSRQTQPEIFDDIDDEVHGTLETSKLIDKDDSIAENKECVIYAHLDLKPANLMIADDGSAILMDFGSCRPARKRINSRVEALQIQDEAAEHSTMPYRAPELFDCPSKGSIDEKVDIWSFGCFLYTLLYGHSPFETAQTASGSIALAVLNCQYTFPDEDSDAMQESLRNVVRSCLQLKADLRPSAEELVKCLQRLDNHNDEQIRT